MTAQWGTVGTWHGTFSSESTEEIGAGMSFGNRSHEVVSGSCTLTRVTQDDGTRPLLWEGPAEVDATIDGSSWGLGTTETRGHFHGRLTASLSIDPQDNSYYFTLQTVRVETTTTFSSGDAPAKEVEPLELGSPTYPPPAAPEQVGAIEGSDTQNSSSMSSKTSWSLAPGGLPLHLTVTATSPEQVKTDQGLVHCIASDPKMPELTISTRIKELTYGEDVASARRVRLEVRYKRTGYRLVKDKATGEKKHVPLPPRHDVIHLPGPKKTDWHEMPAGSGLEWVVEWPEEFRGGQLHVFAEATVQGQALKAQPHGKHWIHGLNATRDEVREHLKVAGIADTSIHVVAHRESRFLQFARSAVNQFVPGPESVLASYDLGFGIGQLTSPKPPVHKLWHWKDNANDILTRLQSARAAAQAYVEAIQQGATLTKANWGKGDLPKVIRKHADAPDMTEDQLDLEMWSRYNSGWRYHNYRPATKTWVRRVRPSTDSDAPSTGCDYADGCMAVRKDVEAGHPPPGWK